jgi:hypothetical protein
MSPLRWPAGVETGSHYDGCQGQGRGRAPALTAVGLAAGTLALRR